MCEDVQVDAIGAGSRNAWGRTSWLIERRCGESLGDGKPAQSEPRDQAMLTGMVLAVDMVMIAFPGRGDASG